MTADTAQRLARLRRVVRWLDSSLRIPGTSRRIGVDPLIGLLPVVGDVASLSLSSWIVAEAHRLGAPRTTLLRMGINLGVDALIGSIPLIGDLWDFGFKANERNLALLERALDLHGIDCAGSQSPRREPTAPIDPPKEQGSRGRLR